ncbi:hypothetical protein ACQP3C_28180, partial [Escherichia coli]
NSPNARIRLKKEIKMAFIWNSTWLSHAKNINFKKPGVLYEISDSDHCMEERKGISLLTKILCEDN